MEQGDQGRRHPRRLSSDGALRACEKIKNHLSHVTAIPFSSVIKRHSLNKFSRCQTKLPRACFQNYPHQFNCKTNIPKLTITTPTLLHAYYPPTDCKQSWIAACWNPYCQKDTKHVWSGAT